MTRNRLLALALFVSVAVNIFAASVFLGPAFRQGPSLGPMTGERYLGSHGERHGERHGLDLHQLEHLSDASQQKVRAIWRDSRRDLHREFRASIKARRGLTEALTAETYDAQAVMAAQADAGKVVTGSYDKAVNVRDIRRPTAGPIRTLQLHSGAVFCLAFAQSRLVTGSADQTVRLCKFDSGT